MYALTLQYTKYIYHSAKEKENINNYYLVCCLLEGLSEVRVVLYLVCCLLVVCQRFVLFYIWFVVCW
jgi:hypothetical protein